MEKKNQNKKFQDLAKKMQTLKETEKGQLKGGFSNANSFSAPLTSDYAGNNCSCTNTVAHCGAIVGQ